MKHPTFTPTGIEAKVCEDIARRQQLGIHKYGRTVADNPLSLLQWLNHLYEELTDAAVYARKMIDDLQGIMDGVRSAHQPQPDPTVGVAQSRATTKKPGKPACRYTWQGRPATIADLAAAAGCKWACMQWRLRKYSVEIAVAMGPSGQQGIKRMKDMSAPLAAKQAAARRYAYAGQELSASELAALAGVTPHQMHLRLRRHPPEAAVAMGPIQARGTSKAAAATTTKRSQSLAADAVAVTPPNAKRTVATKPQERFAVSQVQPHFSGMRPGQYDEDSEGTALVRAGVAR